MKNNSKVCNTYGGDKHRTVTSWDKVRMKRRQQFTLLLYQLYHCITTFIYQLTKTKLVACSWPISCYTCTYKSHKLLQGLLPEQCLNTIVVMREKHCWTNNNATALFQQYIVEWCNNIVLSDVLSDDEATRSSLLLICLF